MTNRDVINGMTNEELGRFLAHIDCVNCAYYSEDGPHVCSKMDKRRETTEIDTCAEGHEKWLDKEPDFRMTDYIHEEGKSECPLCKRYGLEKGDRLYQAYYPDSGISFDEIRVRYCPLCGKALKEDNG